MGARIKAGNSLSGEAKTIEFPSDWTLSEDGDAHVTVANGGSLTASTDVVITSKTGGVSGDIIFKQGSPASEVARIKAGWLGIGSGAAAPVAMIDIQAGSSGAAPTTALNISGYKEALVATHNTDWQGAVHDLFDLYHKSTGDAIFVAHQGGLPAGSGLTPGGNAAFNALIPYNIDGTGTGRDGTTVNDHTGMRGLFIQTQPPQNGVRAIEVDHWGNDPAIVLQVQAPTQFGNPVAQGSGGPLSVTDWSTASSLKIVKSAAPNATLQDAVIQIRGDLGATAIEAIKLVDASGNRNLVLKTDGSLAINDTSGNPAFTISPAGLVTVKNKGGVTNVTAFKIDPANSQVLNSILLFNQAASGAAVTTAHLQANISGDASARVLWQIDGKIRWGDGTAALDTNLYRAAAARLATDHLFQAVTLGLATKVKAGTPTDADWAVAPPDGTIVGDSSGSKFWIRLGGVWKSVAVA